MRARSSIGRQPCSARHSSISFGCSSAWTWRGSSCSSGVPTDLLEPVRGARADGVGGDSDAQPGGAQALDLLDELRDRRPGESGGDPRARRRRAGGRTRCLLLPLPRPPRAPRERRGSGTRRPPCSRRRASRGSPLVLRLARAPASDAPPPRASSRATPRSHRRPRSRAAPAGTCGCARSRSPGVGACPPRGRR